MRNPFGDFFCEKLNKMKKNNYKKSLKKVKDILENNSSLNIMKSSEELNCIVYDIYNILKYNYIKED
ncbi:hypothetical protein [Clostridium baratii]|nr:hypothetical protein [Clostridium baratii]